MKVVTQEEELIDLLDPKNNTGFSEINLMEQQAEIELAEQETDELIKQIEQERRKPERKKPEKSKSKSEDKKEEVNSEPDDMLK